jgi:hypothetical protein
VCTFVSIFKTEMPVLSLHVSCVLKSVAPCHTSVSSAFWTHKIGENNSVRIVTHLF